MKLVNVYFDESGTHADSALLTIAGYWFEEVQADRFSKEWKKHLAQLGLSYAHMTDCALGFGQYKNLSMNERVHSERLLIQCIKRRSRFGFSITINPHEYFRIMTGVDGAPSAYTFCLMALVNHFGRVAMAQSFQGSIRYIFESGHQNQNEADRFLRGIEENGNEWVRTVRYGGHSFCDKRNTLPLQAADMLAWQTGHYFIRKKKGFHKPRKDLVSLIRKCDLYTEYKEDALFAMKDFFTDLAPIVASGDQAGSISKFVDIYQKHDLTWHEPPVLRI